MSNEPWVVQVAGGSYCLLVKRRVDDARLGSAGERS
jgi:hypothetical protein